MRDMQQTKQKSAFTIRRLRFTYRQGLGLAYCLLLLLPVLIAQSVGVQFVDSYRAILSAVTLIAMMAFFVQFPLAGRIKRLPLFANIDWGIAKHKQVGKYLGIFFFLHPFLIVIPKMQVSMSDVGHALLEMISADNLLTGLIAWVALLLWVLSAIYKDKLNLRYETWRFLHVAGFAIIITFATLHITEVGTHGQHTHEFNLLWWALYLTAMGLLVYNYLIKPRTLQGQPFTISALEKISACDWHLALRANDGQKFTFEAGQFAWLNSSDSAFNLEQHPFSIAVEENNRAELAFIIRELGDYTCNLHLLNIGQTVYVDGPYGSMSLAHSRQADAIMLIAGGVGIAPMLSLLRQLIKEGDTRPIHLLYANKNMARMVCLDEIIALEQQRANVTLQLYVDAPDQVYAAQASYVKQGMIGQQDLLEHCNMQAGKEWHVYLCGPEGLMHATTKNLAHVGIAASHIHFEKLSY